MLINVDVIISISKLSVEKYSFWPVKYASESKLENICY